MHPDFYSELGRQRLAELGREATRARLADDVRHAAHVGHEHPDRLRVRLQVGLDRPLGILTRLLGLDRGRTRYPEPGTLQRAGQMGKPRYHGYEEE